MLRYAYAFRVLAEELHFGRAAQRLHITQPALSHQIKMIEQSVGCMLLDRSSHHVALTEAGAGFARELGPALDQIARAKDLALDIARGDAGALSIGYCELPWSGELPGIVSAYAQRFPNMDISLKAMTTNKQAESLRSGALDVAFLHPPVDEAGLASLHIGNERMVAALPRAHPLASRKSLSFAQLAKERLIMCSEISAPHLNAAVMQACSASGQMPRLSMVQDSWHEMAVAAVAGLGVALLPHSVARNYGADLVFVPIRGFTYLLATALVTKAVPSRPAVTRFVDVAARFLGAV